MNKTLPLSMVVSFLLFFITGCSSFSYLTDINDSPNKRPTASDCGSCHIIQFKEWSLSRHSLAFSNRVFQEQYQEADDTACLTCHAPFSVREPNVVGRTFNQAEGVDCISCHYLDGRMHGPHGSTALFQPHPVVEKDHHYLQVALCTSCHGETANEYNETAKGQQLPGCLDCHAALVHRTISQGTGFFSKILVSFEETVESRGHTISLAALQDELNFFLSTRKDKTKGKVTLEIINPLPHNLPTGSYGEKSISLQLDFFREKELISSKKLLISDETAPLPAGGSKLISFQLPAAVQTDDSMLLSLKRFGASNDNRPPVALASKTLALHALDSL